MLGEEGSFAFLVSFSDAFSEEMVLFPVVWLNLLNTFVFFVPVVFFSLYGLCIDGPLTLDHPCQITINIKKFS